MAFFDHSSIMIHLCSNLNYAHKICAVSVIVAGVIVVGISYIIYIIYIYIIYNFSPANTVLSSFGA